MRSNKARRPVLLLLLALAAVFTPAAAKPTAQLPSISRAVVSMHASVSTPSPRGGVEHHQSSAPVLRGAPSAVAVPFPSTAARDDRVSAPPLLLVQGPRPPTQRAASATVLAPTGRSPPSPAGT